MTIIIDMKMCNPIVYKPLCNDVWIGDLKQYFANIPHKKHGHFKGLRR